MKKIIALFLLFNFIACNINFVLAENLTLNEQKYPNYSNIFLNEDKYENFNRKIFNFNLKLNKIFAKKIHILWASLFPNFVIDSMNRVYSNIEFPKRLISSLLQKDMDAVKNETKRFFINTTLGAAGLIDVAYKLFHLEMYNEDMEQALAKCKIKCGNYLILPFISSTTTRDLIGRLFDFALNPTTYVASPIAAAVKMGLLINRTAYIQPMLKMVESNFVDPYDIARKFFGVEKYIKFSNFDRKKILENIKDDKFDEFELVDNQKKEEVLQVRGSVKKNENIVVNDYAKKELTADIFLNDYNPQSPVLDSMRTALLDVKNKNKSMWSEISLWNRSFDKKIKIAEIEILNNRPKYQIRYILQKNKTSPLVILFPSVGEGVNNNHSNILANFFYNEGYSVLILGSHFQWEFLKSLEKGYKIGLIKDDVKYINILVNNSISYLSKKYDRVFLERTALGTSLGAYAVLFLANEQYQSGANNIDKFVAICPPFELIYAVEQIDKIIACWKNYPDDFKEKVAITTAKVIRAFSDVKENAQMPKKLPFSNFEGKLISAFVFHQKLCDLIYETEKINNPDFDSKKFYNLIYNSNFGDYIKKYILVNCSYEELRALTGLNSISDYLINSDNYVIFHSLDDYLISKNQLLTLKKYCDNKLVLFSNGSHLGFLYRDEFTEELKRVISKKPVN